MMHNRFLELQKRAAEAAKAVQVNKKTVFDGGSIYRTECMYYRNLAVCMSM